MDLRALRVVVAVAEHGSVTRAAQALHQSTSAVSHTLLGLEHELKVDLFHRLPRGMTLTDAGEAFVVAATRALHEAEVARRSVDAVRGVVSGEVRVAAVFWFSVPLADLVGAFARRHPGVMVQVFPPEGTDGVAELVRSGTCDVGFTSAPTVSDDLTATPVFVDPGVVVVPEGHRLASHRSVRLAELRGEPMVAPLGTSSMRPLFDAVFRMHDVTPTIAAEAATNEMALELARAGVGCAVTVASSAAAVVVRGAAVVPIVEQTPTDIFLVTRARQQPTPAAQAFGDLAIERRSS